MKVLIIALGVIFAVGPLPIAAIYNNICRLFADGAKIGDPNACNAYITCTNSIGVSTTCAKGQLFSVDSGKCVASNGTCDDPCAPDFDNIWAADVKTCNGYYYCRNGTGTFGVCPSDLHYDEDKQQCIYQSDSNCGGDNYCHIVPNGINFKDEAACDKYYTCKKGLLTSTACKTNLLYDRASAKCVSMALVDGCDSMPTDICIKSKKVVKDKFVDDRATCRGYYYCADKGNETDVSPTWGQCPGGQFFSYDKQACIDPVDIVCAGDRCDGREDGFVNSGTDCTHYLVCKNGKTIAENVCANHLFFDEKRQACTSELIVYAACV